jgi:hypothetical protein
MLSFICTRIGEQDLLLPYAGHIVFTTVAGQGWLAGPKPSLDATQHLRANLRRPSCFARPKACFRAPISVENAARGATLLGGSRPVPRNSLATSALTDGHQHGCRRGIRCAKLSRRTVMMAYR